MGNSVKNKVKPFKLTKLLPDTYLTDLIFCPVCGQEFSEKDTHYAAFLHVKVCYRTFKGKKIKRKPKSIHKRKITKLCATLKSRFDNLRISWQSGCDEIFIDRANMLENSLLQIEGSEDLVNLHKVIYIIIAGMENSLYWRIVN